MVKEKKFKVWAVYLKSWVTVYDRLRREAVHRRRFALEYLATSEKSAKSIFYFDGSWDVANEVRLKEIEVSSFELSEMMDELDRGTLRCVKHYDIEEFEKFFETMRGE